MTHSMMFAEDYLDFDLEAREEADAEVRSALPLEEDPPTMHPEDFFDTDPVAELLRLDAEWRRVDRDLWAACRADEREVVAGRMDKDTYLARDRDRINKANTAKHALEKRARQVMFGMTNQQLKELLDRRNKQHLS